MCDWGERERAPSCGLDGLAVTIYIYIYIDRRTYVHRYCACAALRANVAGPIGYRFSQAESAGYKLEDKLTMESSRQRSRSPRSESQRGTTDSPRPRSQFPLTESERRREDRLRKRRERERKSRASESAEEKEVRLRRRRERDRARQDSETVEQRQARLGHTASYRHTRLQ